MATLAPPSASPVSVRPPRVRALRVLVVDDEAQARRALAAQLMERGFEVLTAEDGDAAAALVEASPVDVMVADYEMPGTRGTELVQRVKAARAGIEVVVIADASHAHDAARCIDDGAFLFLLRPLPSADALAAVVSRAGEKKRASERALLLDRKVGLESPKLDVIATSRGMRLAVDAAFGAAQLRTPILLTGEPGTGRQLLARAVHQRSARADHPFVLVRSGLVASDARDDDWLGEAAGGTLFLEEVGELTASLQARLVDVIASGLPDVRVMASSSADLKRQVDAGTFRHDLYYRLNVVVVRIPSLRRRKDDIPVLAYHLLQRSSQRLGRSVRRISAEALRMLRGYDWPGNVRELEAVIERAVALAASDSILPGDLDQVQDGPEPPEAAPDGAPMSTALQLPAGFDLLPFAEAKKRVVDAFEKAYSSAVLGRSGGNIAEAAQLSGLDRSNFRRILKRQAVTPRKARPGRPDDS